MAQQKIALITGAGRGLGEGMARHLKAAGVTVIGTHRDGTHPDFLHLDVAQFETYPAFVAALHARLDGAGLDYLINNAGIGVYAPYADTTTAQFDALVDINLKAPYFLTQRLLPLINDGGRVLNVTTAVTRGVVPGMSAYAAVKAAVEVLTRYQAAELAERFIRVNAIMGGAVETGFADGVMRSDHVKELAAHTIIQGRIATVDDITAAVPAILSDAFQWATGSVIDVSGGQSL